ncbi:hypothetical protein [Amnibacterium sp.]|uniref:hypothetical protein n=1 Tax=Amnibacterium sp. TaxID=1872496 RepID=UPI003F7BB2C0
MTSILDAVVGRVTMYRLLLIVLLVLGATAVVEALLGVIAFSPLDLIVSAVIACATSWGANRLLALLWRVRPHGESSVITGMLVFCLFWPALTARDVTAVVIASVAANLSKYVLAWHGRHVFNPVALGALLVDVTAISGATWWVATPALLPVIALGGALVVHRSGAWAIAVPVALVAVTGTAVRSVAGGGAWGDAVWTAVASNPFVFLAAFMATEPLTAPPRRWQRLLEGALVGLLTLAPLRLGWLAMSPELALVLGNALAFPFGPRRRVRLTVQSRTVHADGIATMTLRPEGPLHLQAGQYLELSLPHRRQDARGARRVFSLASRPDGEELLIATRFDAPGSTFKRQLARLPLGSTVAGSAVGGDFLLPKRPDTPMLWVAGGIGVTPFRAFADDLAARRERRDVVLVHAVRGGGELDLDDVYDLAGVDLVVLGPAALADRLPGRARYGGPSLRAVDWAAVTPDLSRRTAYVSGPPGLVASMHRTLRRRGVRRVHRDRFIGY